MKIAIAGYGVEGKANYEYFSKRYPDAEFTIVDEGMLNAAALPGHVQTLTGEGVFERLNGFDIVIRTAGLSPYKIVTDGKVWSGTNEFFKECPAHIIGVTGSKGKGTTSSLIASILEADGHKVWLVGNIGVPALDLLDQISKDDIVVYELSSFQLWDVERSPQTAVVLFIEQEHLDVHKDMADYVGAKGNIARFQDPSDRLIYWVGNQYVDSIVDQSHSQRIPFPDKATAHIGEGDFWYGEQRLVGTDILRIRGQHNQSNALAAINAVWPLLNDTASIAAGLGSFTGLPHRLQYVATVHDIEFYDDSIATTPTSAIVGMQTFDASKPIVLILGGSYKGSDFTELTQQVIARGNVTVLLIGAEADRIKDAFVLAGFDKYQVVQPQTMTAIVDEAVRRSSAGGVVLLSPAAASFGLFKNYADRGDQFIAAVKALEDKA
jgi:UDP-N-acetylmuramoylalanine--D-glutamate ligase